MALATMKDFRELKVWHKAHELTLLVYRTTRSFPREELYGITAQMRRASASIPANLAEGCGRIGNPELARFCVIAMGSANDLEYHILLAKDLSLVDSKEHLELTRRTTEVKRMLTALWKKLRCPPVRETQLADH